MEIEIEFKNMLTKQQYDQLLKHFDINQDDIIRQTNHYFETSTGTFKQLKSALRIREIGEYAELTLKEATTEHTSLETTDLLTNDEVTKTLETLVFPTGQVTARLNVLQIPLHDLKLYGTLTTDRVEIPYEDGLLVLDHSFYLHKDDYEVEYETTNEIQGLQVFENFLNSHNIPKQTAAKKIARFMNALQQKG